MMHPVQPMSRESSASEGCEQTYLVYILLKVVGQWSASTSSNQGVGGSIPTLVDVSLKTLNPKILPAAVSSFIN